MPKDIRCSKGKEGNEYFCRDFYTDIPIGQFEGKYDRILLDNAYVMADENTQMFSVHGEYCIDYLKNKTRVLVCNDDRDVIELTAAEKENQSGVKQVEKYY